MAELTITTPAKVTITNTYKIVDPDQLVWNTGLSAIGDPHSNEPIEDA